eukprot:5964344-Prymnesium_polylepis.1
MHRGVLGGGRESAAKKRLGGWRVFGWRERGARGDARGGARGSGAHGLCVRVAAGARGRWFESRRGHSRACP